MPRHTGIAALADRGRSSAGDDVREAVRAAIAASASKLSIGDLQRMVRETGRCDRRLVHAVIRELVAEGELAYAEVNGRTVIEPSFDRPVRVSQRIVLAPPQRSTASESPRDVTVLLQAGAAFGDGRHPSTRLALDGIDTAHCRFMAGMDPAGEAVLDIGTGSGVLVIAAVLLGFDRGVGLDIDSAARAEASANVALNALAGRILIADRPLEELQGRFAMVAANLRWPTLKRLRDRISALLMPEGVLVSAGLQPAELNVAVRWYAVAGYECRWSRSLHGWSAAVLQRAAER